MQPETQEVDFLLDKYKQKLKQQLNISPETLGKPVFSREYKQFKKEYMPKQMTWYEKACNFSEKVLKLKPNSKKAAAMQESIDISHLELTPSGALSFSILAPMFLIFFGSFMAYLTPFMYYSILQTPITTSAIMSNAMFFVVFFVIAGLIIIIPLGKLPSFIANNWRMKASNQMVLCVFYVVTFMRHTSNLELAIEFASEHLEPPLSLDLKKVLWDVETEKYESVKESLDKYLETWRNWNSEFIESIHLIESSLYEPSEARRLAVLDKSLDVMLTETYEKMLHYAHNLKSPITMLHMLGVILPILGLVILPLLVNFMEGVKWYHIATLYNVTLPISVYFMGKSILSKRPTGYGETDISESNPTLKKYKNVIFNVGNVEIKINPIMISATIGVVLFLIGFSPIIMHSLGIPDIGFGGEDINSACGSKFCLMEYRTNKDGIITGPFGLGASILSIFVILAVGLSFGSYYYMRSKNIIQIRNNTKKLEDEFASALFQLGNRLGDGLPAEIAFSKSADVMEDSFSGKFFRLVSSNITRLGMSVKDAIFNPRSGAITFFPSKLISSSMKVLLQSIKKGPSVAAQALMSISRYVKEIHRVNERLRDLMADIIASMKSQIKFLTPAIAGIVVGIASMITTILGSLGKQLSQLAATSGEASAGIGVGALFGEGIPTFYFQIIVGLYVVQIVAILTILANGIENGSDKLAERYSLGNNLIRSSILYAIISLSVILLFNLIAAQIMDVTMTL